MALACRQAPSTPAAAAARPAKPEAAAPQSAAQAGTNGYAFTPTEKKAVEDLLRRNTNLRIARDADLRPARDGDGGVRRLYGTYHPYFVRGDLNDDGILDFVLAFVRRDSGGGSSWFSIVVFTGTTSGGAAAEFSPGTFLERDVSLAHGDLSVDRDAILVTPDLSDDAAVRRYRWDPGRRSYIFVRDEENDAEGPVLSQT